MLKRTFVAVFAASLLAALMIAPTAAAQPIVTGGLVNVVISDIDVETGDILSENTVQVALGAALQLAANVCDVNVNVLAQQLDSGGATCENELGDQRVRIEQIA